MMLSCKKTAELISQSFDSPIPLGTKLGLWIHLAMCNGCRALRSQLSFIQQALLKYRHELAKNETAYEERGLSEEARTRIEKAIQEASADDASK